MSTEAISRDQARELFAKSGLTYSVLSPERMRILRGKINERMVSSGVIGGTFRCRQRATIRDGYAEIRCKASYFDNREAITFNTDGFIGFAGWADSDNVQPILQGFTDWLKEMAPCPITP
ncbi:hypothetical protein [Pseudomonas guariconensis]|uniref:hypothetical protein n=1 Tax=Pseudomonas guariconensis TaxID=1288410 RepID=UPI002D1F358A|nr:hypothetical protein [Pseudomonas guariconensis]MEB3840525.1 hypothetical protein [Pseudomonas guariconensis]MEB3873393.1 hypothetical protein [Pseudomonas guariconensis]MEB3879760.1 hypothetical protein [Pseudomonas guariconensis]MEB3895784.1 hypothetical protein [Pseudomonas guariconensis]